MNTRPSPLAAISLLATAVAALFAGACADTVKAPPGARADTIAQEQYPQVTVESGLQPWIGVNKPSVARENDILKVNTQVRMLADEGRKIQYRYIFLDAKGEPLRTQTGWLYVALEPRIRKELTGNALDSHATDFRLEIRLER